LTKVLGGIALIEKKTEEKKAFRIALETKIQRMFGRTIRGASQEQIFQAISQVVADLVKERWAYSRELRSSHSEKEVYYLSMEFLMGRALSNNLINLGIQDLVMEVCEDLNIKFTDVEEVEPDPGLGNGGLGRLAACFMDSLATLGFKATGCGIRYEYGLFKQKIIDGFQAEVPDPWLENGTSWEIALPEETEIVKFGGFVEIVEEEGRSVYEHKGYQSVRAVPYEVPILGYGTKNVNSLRLWAARATKHLDMSLFGQGKYLDALEEKELAEVILTVISFPTISSVPLKTTISLPLVLPVSCSGSDLLGPSTSISYSWPSMFFRHAKLRAFCNSISFCRRNFLTSKGT